MATATAPNSTPVNKNEKYERIVLEASPAMEKELEEAKDLLDRALCSMPSEDDEKYEQEDTEDEEEEGSSLYEKDLAAISARSKQVLPKDFPFTAYVPEDETIMDKQVFASYTGPVYWNDCGRDFIVDPNQPKENFQPENMANLVYHSLKPLRVHEGGEKPMTVRSFVEGVTALKFIPGDHHFLENIEIQMREIDDKEVMTVVFYTGS